MPVYIAAILGLVFALGCTILALIFITPESRRHTLNSFFTFVHDLFNFKFLFLEKVLKFLYIFNTLYCILAGFFMLFSGERYSSYYYSYFQSYALPGLLLMILGPIAVRIIYEGIMLFILLVKNVIQINNKLKSNDGDNSMQTPFTAPEQTPFTNSAPSEPAPTSAGTTLHVCAHCGAAYEPGQNVCAQCGTPIEL